jgi:ABC-type dipeptide/oligopeptide/nickel transport system permease component
VFRGDLGNSYLTGSSVLGELMRRLPNSFILIIPSLILAAVFGVIIGALGAYFRQRTVGRVSSVFISMAQGIPPFFLGVVLIYLFVFQMRIFPTPVGMLYSNTPPSPSVTGVTLYDAIIAGNFDALGAIAAHAILPVISSAIFLAAYFAKTIRTSVTQTLVAPQIEFARGCGLPEWQVMRYALLSSRTAALTYAAILFGVSLSAQAIIEVVFAWPGTGAWALDGVLKGDLPIIQGFILVTGAIVIVTYLALDVIVAMLDPRIRY